MSYTPTIVDADAHYSETTGELAEYVDSDDPWSHRLENTKYSLRPNSTPDHYGYGRIKRDIVDYLDGEMSPDEIPKAMDHLGLDKTIILSNKCLAFARMRGDDRRPEIFAKAYADFALDKIVDVDEGIYGLAILPHQDVDAAVQLIDRIGDEKGIVGLGLITASPEPPLGNRKYDPIYEAAQDHDQPIVFHAGGSSLDHYHIKGYERFIETHTLGFLQSNMSQLTSIVIQGVPEKFPDLDIVFQESGVLWVPSLMYRLDAEYMKRQSEAPLLEKRPSKYITDFYFGTQPMEEPTEENQEYFENVFELLGAGQLMYSSDYPHWDYDPPSVITDLPFLSEAEKTAILGGNAEGVFGI